MVATAYTKDCYGCMGITAYGLHPGHASSPSTRKSFHSERSCTSRLRPSIAGDIGGDIKGRRIDLGFNSYSQAINFGRREITVYVLR